MSNTYKCPNCDCLVHPEEQANKTVTRIIEEVAENICDNFCRYRDTCDDNCECEWIRQGNDCPLDRLY